MSLGCLCLRFATSKSPVRFGVKHRNRLMPMQQYMVIEHFKPDCGQAVFERLRLKGRMLPPGLHFVNSWVNKELGICYQLMKTGDTQLFREKTGTENRDRFISELSDRD